MVSGATRRSDSGWVSSKPTPFERRKGCGTRLGGGAMTLSRLVFFQHDFCRFDDRRNRVADFQVHFVRASFSDHAFDQVVADFDDHMRHDPTELEFHNLSLKTVAC